MSHDYVSYKPRPSTCATPTWRQQTSFFRIFLLCWSLNSIVLCIVTTSTAQVCACEDIVIERERDRLSPKEYIVLDATAVIYSLQKQQENDIKIKYTYIMSVAANRIVAVTATITDHWRYHQIEILASQTLNIHEKYEVYRVCLVWLWCGWALSFRFFWQVQYMKEANTWM